MRIEHAIATKFEISLEDAFRIIDGLNELDCVDWSYDSYATIYWHAEDVATSLNIKISKKGKSK